MERTNPTSQASQAPRKTFPAGEREDQAIKARREEKIEVYNARARALGLVLISCLDEGLKLQLVTSEEWVSGLNSSRDPFKLMEGIERLCLVDPFGNMAVHERVVRELDS